MPVRTNSRVLFAVLAMLAVAVAQMSGVHGGYACLCGDLMKVVQSDHCHGPHSTDCHASDEAHPDCDTPGGEDRNEHPEVRKELRGTSAPVQTGSVPPAPLTGVLPSACDLPVPVEMPAMHRRSSAHSGPPACIAVVRSVVLLI